MSRNPHTDLKAGCYAPSPTDENSEALRMAVFDQCHHVASVTRTYVRPESLPSKDRKYKNKQNVLNSL